MTERPVEQAKIESIRRERLAAVVLDDTAKSILELLDRKTAVKFPDLKEETGLEWPDICRGVALLAAAEWCDVGSKLRISVAGDRFLSKGGRNLFPQASP